jgi:serine/threonine protein kinase
MSPENISRLEYSEKSDVWSYGATLVELITGNVPFPDLEVVEVATKVRDGLATALDYLPQQCAAPGWVIKLIQKCFTFDEASRPDFAAVLEFLDDFIPEDLHTRRQSTLPVRPVPAAAPVLEAQTASADTNYKPIRFN